MKTVSKEAFQKFLDSYPHELSVHVAHIVQPPYQMYRDPRDENPREHVAGISLDWTGPDGETDFEGDTYHQYRLNDEHPVAADVIKEMGE